MSEQYLVSARKYRPQTFDTVVGQEHITTTLKNAIKQSHLAHAYLFCGPRGVGKTTCARILAKTINCETPTAETEACGHCPTCLSFQNNTSFNVFELDAASNNSVDDIRNLTDQVRFAPQQGKYKIYIIDEVHMLSAAAFNAFLKTLEEPPSYAIFILATTEKHKILPTILSRCQIFDFKRITTQDTVNHLLSITTKEGLIADEAALHVIAQKSEGCMRDSLSMLDRISSFTNGHLTYAGTMEHLNLLDAEFYFAITDCLLSSDVTNALLQLDCVLEKGFEGDIILNGLAEHARNLLLCKDARMAKLLDVPNNLRKTYFEKASQAPPSFLLSSLNIINEAEIGYKNATNKRLHTELCLIKLCYVLQAIAPPDDVKKKSEPNIIQSAQVVAATPPLPQQPVQQTPIEQPLNRTLVQQPTPSTPPVSTNNHTPPPNTPPQKSGASPIMSQNWLNDLDDEIDANDTVNESPVLDQTYISSLFEQFKERLQQENKHVLHAQFNNIKATFLPPDEIQLTVPTKLIESYAQNTRNALLDYFRPICGSMIRITIMLEEDPSFAAGQPTVMSKQDMYIAMAQNNPLLSKLKDALNLQIEY